MRFPVFALMFALFTTTGAMAQADEKAIESTIRQLFQGMENGDSAMAHKSFAKEITMATVKSDKDGKVTMSRETSMAPWLKAIGTPHPDKWYEEIWGLKISVDGKFAQVWCDYALYRGNTFSHCGVDAFQLVKEDSDWKIFHVADTRRVVNCNIPAAIQNKHK